MNEQTDRAHGCLLGQVIGDSLGSLVEFLTYSQITRKYPAGVCNLDDGGTWNTLAGQPTDDSELAIALARSIVANGTYDASTVRGAYVDWLRSNPFDIGNTVRAGLQGVPIYDSQANGALMRVSPLGIYSVHVDEDIAARFAREDAWLTHPNEVTQDANVVFVLTIRRAIRERLSPPATYEAALKVAREHGLVSSVQHAVEIASSTLPETFNERQGWVLIALQNAFYQLANAPSFEHALIETVGYGGDTDTNAAIAGALLGAVYGRSGIPERWIQPVLTCRPSPDNPRSQQPRPQQYWPVDVLELASDLLTASRRI